MAKFVYLGFLASNAAVQRRAKRVRLTAYMHMGRFSSVEGHKEETVRPYLLHCGHRSFPRAPRPFLSGSPPGSILPRAWVGQPLCITVVRFCEVSHIDSRVTLTDIESPSQRPTVGSKARILQNLQKTTRTTPNAKLNGRADAQQLHSVRNDSQPAKRHFAVRCSEWLESATSPQSSRQRTPRATSSHLRH
ncbi:hypothetical protein ES705_43301 [subsurface metagenome]